jgi:hypothetical protein
VCVCVKGSYSLFKDQAVAYILAVSDGPHVSLEGIFDL